MAPIWLASLLALPLRGAPPPVGIAGGVEAGTCQVPMVGTFRAGEQRCSAVLVHPRVLLTAAHCFYDGPPAEVRFGETFNLDQLKPLLDHCVAHPEHPGDDRTAPHDIAVCLLAEPVETMPLAPVLAPCEAADVGVGTQVIIAGFGVPDDADGSFGRKRYAHTEITAAEDDDGMIAIGDGATSGCLGDSGGPALVQVADGSWRVLGVLSGGPACSDVAHYVSVPAHLAWLEDAAGLDLTPCDDGADDCAGFVLDPLAEASWSDDCRSELSSGTPACAGSGTGEGSDDTGTEGMAAGATAGCGCTPTRRRRPWLVLLLVGAARPRARAQSSS